jgi:endonuclease YncB( thermonuclease family)
MNRFMFFLSLSTIMAFAAFGLSANAASNIYIKDGDSFVIDGREIRLWGIDAPEFSQICHRSGVEYSCGIEARSVLTSLIDVSSLRCEEKPRARSESRIVARCFVGQRDLGQLMVQTV